MDFQVGDTLFGYPIAEITETTIRITIPAGGANAPQIEFDRTQFNEGVRVTLRQLGAWTPQGSAA